MQHAYIKTTTPFRGIKAMKKESYIHIWPEDPCWPDPSGNDPYDVVY